MKSHWQLTTLKQIVSKESRLRKRVTGNSTHLLTLVILAGTICNVVPLQSPTFNYMAYVDYSISY